MNSIFQYGCYSVGSAKAQICQNYHEVIQLTLQEKDKRLTKKRYTLEELRDLESKLVLITGSKVENRAQVETFIDVRWKYQILWYCREALYDKRIRIAFMIVYSEDVMSPKKSIPPQIVQTLAHYDFKSLVSIL